MQVGMGCRVGEMTETYWALIAPFSKIARYMTLAHWHDGMNLAFDIISSTKQRNFIELMVSKLKRNGRQLGVLAHIYKCYDG